MSETSNFSQSSQVFLTVEEAAARLRLGRTTVYQLIKEGAIVSVRVKGCRRVPTKALEVFADKLVAEQLPSAPRSA